MQKNEFGKIIAKERKKQGLSQPKLAEMTGFSDRTISLWETGKRGITITSADKVAKALGITVTIGKVGVAGGIYGKQVLNDQYSNSGNHWDKK